jgi:hypothetical protein
VLTAIGTPAKARADFVDEAIELVAGVWTDIEEAVGSVIKVSPKFPCASSCHVPSNSFASMCPYIILLAIRFDLNAFCAVSQWRWQWQWRWWQH